MICIEIWTKSILSLGEICVHVSFLTGFFSNFKIRNLEIDRTLLCKMHYPRFYHERCLHCKRICYMFMSWWHNCVYFTMHLWYLLPMHQTFRCVHIWETVGEKDLGGKRHLCGNSGETARVIQVWLPPSRIAYELHVTCWVKHTQGPQGLENHIINS